MKNPNVKVSIIKVCVCFCYELSSDPSALCSSSSRRNHQFHRLSVADVHSWTCHCVVTREQILCNFSNDTSAAVTIPTIRSEKGLKVNKEGITRSHDFPQGSRALGLKSSFFINRSFEIIQSIPLFCSIPLSYKSASAACCYRPKLP